MSFLPLLATGIDGPQTETQTERISISTLLDTGTDSFIRPCNFPSQDAQVSTTSNEDTPRTRTSSEDLNVFDNTYSNLMEMYLNEDFTYFDEAFTSGINFPIHPQSISLVDADAGPEVGYILPTPVEINGTPITPAYQRVEPPYVGALRDCLLSKLYQLGIGEDRMDEIMLDLDFFFTVDCVERFISLYFDNWHRNGPILHQPTFSPCTTRTWLLLAVTIFGAIYSRKPREHRIAASLLDATELAIFSTPPFSCTASIANKLNGPRPVLTETDAWDDFEDLQAAYLISTVQYWAGDQSGRNRIIENRFGDVIQVYLMSCRKNIAFTNGTQGSEKTGTYEDPAHLARSDFRTSMDQERTSSPVRLSSNGHRMTKLTQTLERCI